VPLPRFTLVGATTAWGADSPLRDRFGLIQRLRFYEPDGEIVLRTAQILQTPLTDDGVLNLPVALVGPRIANRLLKRVRDYALGQLSRLPGSAAALELFPGRPLRFGLD